jgi:hypothetical protein
MNLKPLRGQFLNQLFPHQRPVRGKLPLDDFGFDVILSRDFGETVFPGYFCAADAFGAGGFEFEEEFFDFGVGVVVYGFGLGFDEVVAFLEDPIPQLALARSRAGWEGPIAEFGEFFFYFFEHFEGCCTFLVCFCFFFVDWVVR